MLSGDVLGDTVAVSDPDAGVRSILLVEDDEEIAGLMRDFLEAEGFNVRHAATGRDATEELEHARPDCVLLDVMLPDESGFEICRRLRRDSDIPVLFLSARDGDADKIRGLGLGGDDYVVKSATPGEVVARIKAVLRRAAPAGVIAGRQRLRFGDLEVDLGAHEVAREGRRVDMTAREFEVLRVFVEHPRQVLSRDHLFELIWGSFGDRSAVPVYIRRLREKIELDPAKPRYIVTVWGAGYRFDGGLT
jgi:DNA-binding response OmpR family regulator